MRRDDPPIRPEVADAMKRIGKTLQDILPPGMGFAFLAFDLGEGGHISYISNGQREDVIKALREFIARNDVES